MGAHRGAQSLVPIVWGVRTARRQGDVPCLTWEGDPPVDQISPSSQNHSSSRMPNSHLIASMVSSKAWL